MIWLHFIGPIAQSYCLVRTSMSAMRQNIDIVVGLVEEKTKMDTYDNHVQEFEVCYIADDWMTLKENNMFDWHEIQIHWE